MRYECGKCDKTFGSVQGLGGHTARGHKRRKSQPKSNRDFKAMSDKAESQADKFFGKAKAQVAGEPPTEMSFHQLRDKAIQFLRAKADDHYRMHEHYICAIVDLENDKNGASK